MEYSLTKSDIEKEKDSNRDVSLDELIKKGELNKIAISCIESANTNPENNISDIE